MYAASGVLAAAFMVVMTGFVVVQIVARLVGFQVPSADDFARLAMAASAFLGLAFALRTGAHIRVTLLLDKLPPAAQRWFEIGCLIAATATCYWFAWSTFDTAIDSWKIDEYTIGQIPIPKWIPLLGMALGILLVAIAFTEDLYEVVLGRTPSYKRPSEFANTEG
jgi:TRAP-type C4-dicarboxylate transport system permease small subunit